MTNFSSVAAYLLKKFWLLLAVLLVLFALVLSAARYALPHIEHNKHLLENYINELDDNEKAMEVMKHEYSKVINDISEVNNNIQSTNNYTYNTMENRYRQLEFYMVIVAIYSYMIGSYGLGPIVTQHFTFIVYYPMTMLIFVFKMLINAVII